MSEKEEGRPRGLGIGTGIAIGAGIGIAMGNLAIGIGVGTGGSNGSVGVSGGIPVGTDEIEQHLTFDLVDVKKDELIWQAVLEGRFKEYASPTQKRNYYQKGGHDSMQ